MNLGTPRIFAASADVVDTQPAVTALDGKVGLATRRTQRNGRACANRLAGHFIESDAAETNAFPYFLHAYPITREAVALPAPLYIHRHLAVGHVGAIDAQVPVDAAGTRHRAGETIGNSLLLVNEADTLGTSVKDLVTGEQRLQLST